MEGGHHEVLCGKSESRQRKKRLLQQIREQLEFYFSPANLSKDLFMSELLSESEYISLETFLKFNKIRSMTETVKMLRKAVGKSDILELSEDKTKLKLKIPYKPKKEDELIQSISTSPKTSSDSNRDNGTFTETEESSPDLIPLTADEIFKLVLNVQPDAVLDKVPGGDKSNRRFVLKNEENMQRYSENKKIMFPDDCRAWTDTKGTTTKTTFVITDSNTLKTIHLKNDLYCIPKKIKKKITWMPVDPQPDPSRLLKMHRYYSSLASNMNFKKRVTWLEIPQSYADVPPVAVVEYIGKQASTQLPHGNAKGLKNPYIKTSPDTMKKIKKAVKHDPPKRAYKRMLEADDDARPRSCKQFTDAKSRECKRKGAPAGTNIADDVLQVISMVNEHPYVQELVMSKGKPPAVILYTSEQLDDLRAFVEAGTDQVIGIDRTSNLGPCYVTSIVYKNLRVVRGNTKEHPIMIGPLFLHWDGAYEAYHQFFSHIQRKLQGTISSTVIHLGSDEEKAIVKALESVFPKAKHYLCTRHLKKNVQRYLQDKAGVDTQTCKEIVNKIFGPDGLVNSEDTFSFEERAHDLCNHADENMSKFIKYFNNRLLSLLVENVNKYQTSGDKLWTNNSESINHLMKVCVNWRSQRLPDLIESLYSEVKLQMLNLRRCLHGLGEYVLCQEHKRFFKPDSVWRQLPEDLKEEHFNKFLCTAIG